MRAGEFADGPHRAREDRHGIGNINLRDPGDLSHQAGGAPEHR
jgi:hypothetical protein